MKYGRVFGTVGIVIAAILAIVQIHELRRELEISRNALREEERAFTEVSTRLREFETRMRNIQKGVEKSPATEASSLPAMSRIGPASTSSPEANLLSIVARGDLDVQYGDLFRQLNLPRDKLSRFKDLLVERANAARDAVNVAIADGIAPERDPVGLSKVMTRVMQTSDDELRQVLTDSGYAEYQMYESTRPERNTIRRLADSLSYSRFPLSPDQQQQLIQLFSDNGPKGLRMSVGTDGPLLGSVTAQRNQSAQITDEYVRNASSILSPEQIADLLELQRQQAAERQLIQLQRRRHRG